MENFGKVEFQGNTYTLKTQADFTGRQLLDWQMAEGWAEFSALGEDLEGFEVTVYWILNILDDNGNVLEDLEGLAWENVDRVFEN